MNKKLIAFLSMLGLSFAISLVPAYSAIKAGSSCKTAGIKSIVSGKTFTCIKSGKKLVWDKGMVMVKPIQTLTPKSDSVTQVTISFDNLEKNTKEVKTAAWNSYLDKIAYSKDVQVVNNFYIGPNTKPNNSEFQSAFKKAALILGSFKQPTNFVTVIYEHSDVKWAKDKLTSLGLPNSKVQEVDGSCASFERCNGASAGKYATDQFFAQLAVPKILNQIDSYHKNGALEMHEYTHIVQQAQFPGASWGGLPSWFSEGHAHAIGNLGASNSKLEYERNRSAWLATSPNEVIKSFAPENIERFYAALGPNNYNSDMFGYVYTLGYITVECLIAIKGIDSPMELISYVANGNSFEDAFKKVYGIPWSDASPILARAVSAQFN
jgi:hypothetical protein